MGIFSAIGSALGAVGSLFSGAVSSLGGLGSILFKGLSSLGTLLGPVGNTLSIIGLVSGLFKKETNPEDLGFQIREARERGIFREDFDSYEDYFENISNIEINKDNASELDKFNAVALGSTHTMLGLNEKAGQEINLGTYEFITNSNIDVKKLSITDLKNISNTLNLNKVTYEKLDKYKNNKLIGIERENIDNVLTEISEIVNIDKSELLK